MPYRELHVIEIKEVLRLWAGGVGLREVTRRTGLDRKTVRRYVEAAQGHGFEQGETAEIDDRLISRVVAAVVPGGSTEAGPMRELCREHHELLAGLHREGCKGPKLVKLLERQTGTRVPLRTLQRFVAEELDIDEGGVRIVDGPPGELLIDFLELGGFDDLESGKPRKLHALLCTAAFSRHQFLWPCLRQTRDDVIEGLEAAWRFFGGVFPLVVCDNLRAIVDEADPISPTLNLAFVEYMQARGFQVDAARSFKPKDKARVERQVQFGRNDYFKGERFRTLSEARFEAERWCRVDAGERTHGTLRRRPIEVFEAEERATLLPPPAEPYDPPRWSEHRVGPTHAIVVGYALYSVPWQLGECDLRVRSDKSTVKMYCKRQLVKVHPRQPEGGSRIDPADVPEHKVALATRDATPLCEKAATHGQHVGEYARRLMEGPLPWSRIRHVYRLLGLVERYGAKTVDTACGQALALDVVEVIRIDRMLAKNLVKADRSSEPQPARRAESPKARTLRFARNPAEFRPEVSRAES